MIYVIGILLVIISFTAGWVLKPTMPEPPLMLHVASTCMSVMQHVKTIDPSLDNAAALAIAEGVVEWAQEHTT